MGQRLSLLASSDYLEMTAQRTLMLTRSLLLGQTLMQVSRHEMQQQSEGSCLLGLAVSAWPDEKDMMKLEVRLEV